MNEVERAVRAMTRLERVAYLRAHGWHRLSKRGSQCWLAPGWLRRAGWNEPGPDRGFYTLAAAIRTALEEVTR